jgi:hypothetical protein
MLGVHCPRPGLDFMAKVLEELVPARKGCAEAGFSARGEKLDVDVSFVL